MILFVVIYGTVRLQGFLYFQLYYFSEQFSKFVFTCIIVSAIEFFVINLDRVPNLCGPSPARTVFLSCPDSGITQNQLVVARFDSVSVILIETFGLALPHATN